MLYLNFEARDWSVLGGTQRVRETTQERTDFVHRKLHLRLGDYPLTPDGRHGGTTHVPPVPTR